uniref:NADH dehydrogenase subunit 6 n=1 Tax=Aconurella diplachnis TaxID=2855833 RepID=UPI0024356D18|nr:NADH dehydrogenase subunit 6 [Aconurella diplachnis]WEU77740.1 NADH dehydrogenase subunit 6 [Aconurella diplachnis]
MKFFMIKMLMTISTLIMFLKTPMSMGVFLLIQTTLTTLLISKMAFTSWMSMVMFLMFIGGLLILFMYMSSIASNEKFKPNLKLMIIFLIMMFPMEEMLMEIQTNELMSSNIKMDMISMSKIYNKKTMMMTLFLFLYMLLSMISVTVIVKMFKGPLRAKNT